MKNITVFISAVLFTVLINYSGFAQTTSGIPRTISYQGSLLDATQRPVTGNHHITVRLYDAPSEGNLVHSENFTSDFTNGVFSVIIGSQQALDPAMNFDKKYWLGVSVDESAELSPRTAFSSVPYSIHANSASSLSKGATGAVTSMNGKSGEIMIKGGLGTEIETDGNTITITAVPLTSRGEVHTAATTVNSVTGTTNQITANPTTGNVVLSLPQNIHTAATPTFSGMTLTNLNNAGVVHNSGAGALSTSLVSNADVANNANIAYSKLNLAASIDNGDIAAGANIAYSKLNLANAITSADIATGTIVNSDISAGAAIAASKLNLTNAITSGDIAAGAIVNTDINANANIDYGKLNLTGNIVNADIAAGANISASKLNLANAITSGSIVAGAIVNSDINANASIAYSKLNLAGNIVNADLAGNANVAYSKLNLTGNITNSDIAAGANISASKLNLTNAVTSGSIVAGTIVNSDVNANANIAYGKLNLTGNIVNGDIAGGANISYGKLNLAGSVVNADIAAGANIAYNKLNLSGNIVNGDIAAGANISASKLNLANAITSGMIAAGTIVNTDINANANIAYSKLNLAGNIVNADIAGGAAIADSKLATISTPGKVSNSATTAASTNTANTIALRDASGNFSANTITATLSGTATNVSGTVSETHGGTNQTTYTTGDILYASGANTLAKRGIGSVGQVLTISGGVPVWAALSGVGVTSLAGTANQILVNGGTGAQIGGLTLSLPASPTVTGLTLSGLNTVGVVHNSAAGLLSTSLITNADVAAAAAIVDTKLATISTAGKVSNTATTATASNTNNTIVLRDGSGNFSAGTVTANLTGNASGTSANITGIATETHGGTNQNSYATGDMLYATSANTLAKRAVGTNGQVLTVSGGVPVWSTVGATVSSAIGTANGITINGDLLSHTGAITLNTVQPIATTSSPSFTGLTLTAKATSASTDAADPAATLTTKDYVDNTITNVAVQKWNIGGNTGMDANSYLGTNDASSLCFRTNSSETMKLTDGGSLLLSGTYGDVPVNGSGTRMMWVSSLGAFRAGSADGDSWNSSNVGMQSSAMGLGTVASGAQSFAIGEYSYATGDQSVAMGLGTNAYGIGSTAFGIGTYATIDGATSMGSSAQANGVNSVALGDQAAANGTGSVALGHSMANGEFSTAFGYLTTAGDHSAAMGRNLTLGSSSFGFNGGTSAMDLSALSMNNVAYLGDVDLVIGNDDNIARSLKFYGPNGTTDLNAGFYSSFIAGSQSANISYTLPLSQGASNSIMTNNGSGNLSWSTLSSLGVPTGSGTANNLAVWNSLNTLGASSNLYYSSNKLGIGSSSPAEALDVTGNATVSGSVTAGSITSSGNVSANGISMTGGATVLSYNTITASASLTIPNTSVVKIILHAGSDVNNVTMPSGTNGQIIYIYNDDDDATTGDVIISAHTMGAFVYVDNWRKAN